MFENLRQVFPSSIRLGAAIGVVAYAFVFGFTGIDMLAGGRADLARELWLASQYAAIGIGGTVALAVVVSIATSLLRRDIQCVPFSSVVVGTVVFGVVFLPLELTWLLAHRPINPASRAFFLASGGFLLAAAAAGLVAAFVVSRFPQRLVRHGSILVLGAALIAIPLGLGCARALLEPPTSSGSENPRKVVIVGLDGGTWSLIEPMMARGELPNLQWLVAHGSSGSLRSLVPIESPRVWTSIATGKLPEKHGIDRFIIDRRFIRTATLWDIADAAGKRVGLYDWLVTYPPKPIDGYVIPGWLAGGKSNTYPEKMGKSLFIVRSLRNPFWFSSIAAFRLPAGYLEQARGNPIPRGINSQFVKSEFKQLDVPYLRAAHDTDLFAVVFYGSDVLAHSMWQFMEPEHFPEVDPDAVEKYGDALPAYYRLVDDAIEAIRAEYDASTSFVIVSDHGFRRAETLDRMDYIIADTLLLDIGLSAVAENVGGAKDHAIIALKSGLGLTEAESEELRSTLVTSLNLLRTTAGKPAFQAERMDDGDEIRVSLHAGLDPDAGHLVEVGENLFPLGKYLQRAVLSGEHDIDGILILYGPDVRRNHELKDARVVDIAPTVLYMLGLPVGRDMDGEVLTDAFSPRTLAAREVETIASYDDALEQEAPPERPDVDPELMERLRSLGYLK